MSKKKTASRASGSLSIEPGPEPDSQTTNADALRAERDEAVRVAEANAERLMSLEAENDALRRMQPRAPNVRIGALPTDEASLAALVSQLGDEYRRLLAFGRTLPSHTQAVRRRWQTAKKQLDAIRIEAARSSGGGGR